MNFHNKKYNIIYADPPWKFNFKNRKGLSDEAKSKLYPTMDANEIINLNISSISENDCILFLWVMNFEIPL